jgi:hypothetical protein
MKTAIGILIPNTGVKETVITAWYDSVTAAVPLLLEITD